MCLYKIRTLARFQTCACVQVLTAATEPAGPRQGHRCVRLTPLHALVGHFSGPDYRPQDCPVRGRVSVRFCSVPLPGLAERSTACAQTSRRRLLLASRCHHPVLTPVTAGRSLRRQVLGLQRAGGRFYTCALPGPRVQTASRRPCPASRFPLAERDSGDVWRKEAGGTEYRERDWKDWRGPGSGLYWTAAASGSPGFLTS